MQKTKFSPDVSVGAFEFYLEFLNPSQFGLTAYKTITADARRAITTDIINNQTRRKKRRGIIKKFFNYEFRTTILPRFHKKEDIINIDLWLKGSRKYFLQQFRPGKTLDSSFEKEKPYSLEECFRHGHLPDNPVLL